MILMQEQETAQAQNAPIPVWVGSAGLVWYYTEDTSRRGGGFVSAFTADDNPAATGVDLAWIQRHNPDLYPKEEEQAAGVADDLRCALDACDAYLLCHLAQGRLYEHATGDTTGRPVDAVLQRCGIVLHALRATPVGEDTRSAAGDATVTIPVAMTLNPCACDRVATTLGRIVAAHARRHSLDYADCGETAQLDRHMIVAQLDVRARGTSHRLQITDLNADLHNHGFSISGAGRLRNVDGPDIPVTLAGERLPYSAIRELAALQPGR